MRYLSFVLPLFVSTTSLASMAPQAASCAITSASKGDYTMELFVQSDTQAYLVVDLKQKQPDMPFSKFMLTVPLEISTDGSQFTIGTTPQNKITITKGNDTEIQFSEENGDEKGRCVANW